MKTSYFMVLTGSTDSDISVGSYPVKSPVSVKSPTPKSPTPVKSPDAKKPEIVPPVVKVPRQIVLPEKTSPVTRSNTGSLPQRTEKVRKLASQPTGPNIFKKAKLRKEDKPDRRKLLVGKERRILNKSKVRGGLKVKRSRRARIRPKSEQKRARESKKTAEDRQLVKTIKVEEQEKDDTGHGSFGRKMRVSSSAPAVLQSNESSPSFATLQTVKEEPLPQDTGTSTVSALVKQLFAVIGQFSCTSIAHCFLF